jgi:hypothetical protein
MPATTEPLASESKLPSTTLLQLTRPLLDYRIIVTVLKDKVGPARILKDALKTSRDLKLPTPLLALGPTRLSLNPPPDARILWTTFADNCNTTTGQSFTIVQPGNLVDIKLNLEKLSKTEDGYIPLIIGDFLDNILSTPTTPANLCSFLSELFNRIKTNEQTAFLLATDDMHETKKKNILRKFADLIIEYNSVEDMAGQRIQAHIIDPSQSEYSQWNFNQTPGPNPNHFISRTTRVGRRYNLQLATHVTRVKRPYAIAKTTFREHNTHPIGVW